MKPLNSGFFVKAKSSTVEEFSTNSEFLFNEKKTFLLMRGPLLQGFSLFGLNLASQNLHLVNQNLGELSTRSNRPQLPEK